MIKRLKQVWPWLLVLAAVNVGVWVLGAWLMSREIQRAFLIGTVQGLVISTAQFLLMARPGLRREQEENQAAFAQARQSAARERDARTEEAARSYERQHGRRPW